MKHMQGLARLLLCLALVVAWAVPALAVMLPKTGLNSTDGTPVTNTGNLVVDGTKIDALGGNNTYTVGIYTLDVQGNVTNKGTITSTTDGYVLESYYAESYGIEAYSTNGSVLNSGTINVDAHAPSSYARGISASATGDIINTGSINVLAHSGSSSAVGIWGQVAGDILNSGSLTVTANSTTGVEASGIRASLNGLVSNSDVISVTAISSSSSARAYGLDISGAERIANAGSIATSTTGVDFSESTGIFARDAYSVRNSGSVNSEASSDNNAYAYGIQSMFVSDTENTGSILASASGLEAYAFGISAFSPIKSGSFEVRQSDHDEYFPAPSILNSGTIQAFSSGMNYSVAAGIWSPFPMDVVNTGTGAIEAQAQGILAMAAGIAVGVEEEGIGYGLDDDDGFQFVSLDFINNSFGSVSNEGSITVTASGAHVAQAVGIIGADVEDIDNSGTLTVTATTDEYETEIESMGPSGMAMAIGMAGMGIYGDMVNSGEINVSTGDAYGFAVGMMAGYGYGYGYNPHASREIIDEGPYPFQQIVNSGTINMDSYEGAGIVVGGGEWDVYNPGTIYTSNYVRTLYVGESYFFGPRAAIDLKNGEGNGFYGPYAHARLVDDFRIVFRDDPRECGYTRPILVGYGGSLDLNDATLIAQAGNTIVWNTPYPVIESYSENGGNDMRLLTISDSPVSGTFSGLQSANPNITVSWYDEEETGDDAAVVFQYNPQATAPAAGIRLANLGAIQNSNLIQQRTFSQLLARHIKEQETLLADSGQTASDAGFLIAKSGEYLENSVFIRPYLKTVSRDEENGMGYNGGLLGMILGYERMLAPELTLGVHGGFGLGSIDYTGTGFDSNEETLAVYSLGVHGAYNPGAWHFDGSLTFYAADHEYEGLTGGALEIDEEDDYMSYGAEAEVLGGYVFATGNWAAMPYLGLGYSWINAPSHTTDAGNPAWDTHYGSVDEHILRSILGAQVSANWMVGQTKVIPTLGLRWEYALTDNDISVSQRLLGSQSVTVKDDIARSSIIGDLSVVFSKDVASLELGAMGEYNEDITSLGGWLTLKYAF